MRRLLFLSVLLLGSACRREPPRLTDAALSMLVASPSGGCDWKRVDPATTRVDIVANVDAPCVDLAVAWDALGQRALLATRTSAWLLDANGELARLAPPVAADLLRDDPSKPVEGVAVAITSIYFSETGHPSIGTRTTGNVLLDGDPLCSATRAAQSLVDGQWVLGARTDPDGCVESGAPVTGPFPRLRPFDEGEPLDDATRYRVETAFPKDVESLKKQADHYPVEESEAAKLLTKKSRAIVERRMEYARERARTAANPSDKGLAQSIAEKLQALHESEAELSRQILLGEVQVPSDPESRAAQQTITLAEERRDFAKRELAADWTGVTFGSGITVARRAATWVFVRANDVVTPPDAPKSIETVWARDGYLLMTSDGGTTPRLYDGKTGALVWKSDEAVFTTFWPKPAMPQQPVAQR